MTCVIHCKSYIFTALKMRIIHVGIMWFREIDKSNKNFRFSKLKYLETGRRVNLVKHVYSCYRPSKVVSEVDFSANIKQYKNYKKIDFDISFVETVEFQTVVYNA